MKSYHNVLILTSLISFGFAIQGCLGYLINDKNRNEDENLYKNKNRSYELYTRRLFEAESSSSFENRILQKYSDQLKIGQFSSKDQYPSYQQVEELMSQLFKMPNPVSKTTEREQELSNIMSFDNYSTAENNNNKSQLQLLGRPLPSSDSFNLCFDEFRDEIVRKLIVGVSYEGRIQTAIMFKAGVKSDKLNEDEIFWKLQNKIIKNILKEESNLLNKRDDDPEIVNRRSNSNKIIKSLLEDSEKILKSFSASRTSTLKTSSSALLISALHHPREPASLTVVLYAMLKTAQAHMQVKCAQKGNLAKIDPSDYLTAFENIREQYLVVDRTLIFFPFVNPDGYVTIETSGIKEVRKNRRPTCSRPLDAYTEDKESYNAFMAVDRTRPLGSQTIVNNINNSNNPISYKQVSRSKSDHYAPWNGRFGFWKPWDTFLRGGKGRLLSALFPLKRKDRFSPRSIRDRRNEKYSNYFNEDKDCINDVGVIICTNKTEETRRMEEREGRSILSRRRRNGRSINVRETRDVRKLQNKDLTVRDGVDLNRNYDDHFEKSHSPCDDQEYEGAKAFSEPETRTMRRIAKFIPSISMALNFHSYGDIWTHPFNCCYNKTLDPIVEDVLSDLSNMINVTFFGPAPRAPMLGYTTSGEADDYLLSHHNIISMSPEVGPESAGFYPPCSVLSEINIKTFERIINVLSMTDSNFILSLENGRNKNQKCKLLDQQTSPNLKYLRIQTEDKRDDQNNERNISLYIANAGLNSSVWMNSAILNVAVGTVTGEMKNNFVEFINSKSDYLSEGSKQYLSVTNNLLNSFTTNEENEENKYFLSLLPEGRQISKLEINISKNSFNLISSSRHKPAIRFCLSLVPKSTAPSLVAFRQCAVLPVVEDEATTSDNEVKTTGCSLSSPTRMQFVNSSLSDASTKEDAEVLMQQVINWKPSETKTGVKDHHYTIPFSPDGYLVSSEIAIPLAMLVSTDDVVPNDSFTSSLSPTGVIVTAGTPLILLAICFVTWRSRVSLNWSVKHLWTSFRRIIHIST